jgi:hypothetical protein
MEYQFEIYKNGNIHIRLFLIKITSTYYNSLLMTEKKKE